MTYNNPKILADHIPTVMGKKLAACLDNSGVMMQCVNKDYEGEIKAKGDTVRVMVPGNISVSTYTGTIGSYADLSSTYQDLVINQEKIFAFKVPDTTSIQTGVNLYEKFVERAKIAIDLEKDSYIFSLHTNTPADNTIGSTTEPIALTSQNIYGYFADLRKKLAMSNALAGGKRPWIVISPDVESLMIKSSEFTHASSLGDEVLKEGQIGRVAGFDVLTSTNLSTISATVNSEEVDANVIFAGTTDAITFASQIIQIEKNRDPNSFSDLVRGLYVYGAKVVVPNALAKMICTV